MNVKIISSGGLFGTKILDEAGNDLSSYVSAVTWRAQAGDICRVDLELTAVEVEVEGVAKVYGPGGKAIKRVEYEDGTVDEF